MVLNSWAQRVKLVLVGTILGLALSHGLVVAQSTNDGEHGFEGIDENIESAEESEKALQEDIFNSFGIDGAAKNTLEGDTEYYQELKKSDYETYQCYKFEKICPDKGQESTLSDPSLRLECAVCKGYLTGPELEYYKKHFYYDYNADYKFEGIEERAIASLNNNSEDVEIPTSTSSGSSSKYAVYLQQRANIGDRPTSSEFFDVTDPNKGLLAEGQRSFFSDDNQNPVLAFIVRVVEFLISMIGLATLVVVVIGAYLLLTAAGDEEQLSKGKDVIKLGLLGMVIAIFAYSIVTFVQALIY